MIQQQLKQIAMFTAGCLVTFVATAATPTKGSDAKNEEAAKTESSPTFELDKAHTEVGFKVRHMMISDVAGKFTDFKGTFEFDEKKKEIKNIDIEIASNSISTGNTDRDKHLSSADFFDVEKNKTITFKLDKSTLKPNKTTLLTGTLSMHGKSNPITLEATYSGPVKDMQGHQRLGFELKTPADKPLSRKEYNLVWNKTLETGGVVVGDPVRVDITGEAVQK